ADRICRLMADPATAWHSATPRARTRWRATRSTGWLPRSKASISPNSPAAASSPRTNLNGRRPDMCGIAGKFNFDPLNPIDRGQLAAMTTVIAHRGPDADGFYVGDGIGLGHRRLSIIDLSTGDQPLMNEDRTIWV